MASTEAAPPVPDVPKAEKPKGKNLIFLHPDLGIGGAERLILDAALGLQARGHQVTIYTSHCDKTHCFEEARDGSLDVRVRGNRIFPAHILQRFHVLLASLRQAQLVLQIIFGGDVAKLTGGDARGYGRRDTVFIVDQATAGLPLIRWFARGETRILFYCHFPDQLLAQRNEGGLMGLVKSVYRVPFDWFEGWSLTGADSVVVNSGFTRNTVSDLFKGYLKKEDLKVVYPCVDVDAKSLEGKEGPRDMVQEEVDAKKGALWGGKKILLSINRFERKKDIALAVLAYSELKPEERKNTRLVLAGGYDQRVRENVLYHKELEGLATELGLQHATAKTVISALDIPSKIDVLFLLSIPNAFKATLLKSATLLLYTPTNEHFGIVPVEAMHAGLPVLATNTGGPLETIVEGETGFLRSAGDIESWTKVMRTVLSKKSETKLTQMGENGKRRVEKEFSRTVMAERIDAELDEILTRRRGDFVEFQDIMVAIMGLIVLIVAAFGIYWEIYFRKPGKVVLANWKMPVEEQRRLLREAD